MRVRLFIAVELAGEDRAALADWAACAAGRDPALRLVAPGDLHLTLAFLGQREADEVPGLTDLVGGLPPAAPMLATGEVLWLPAARPSVLTVAVRDADGQLGRTHARLWERLAALGHVPEDRPYRPHVTLARVRRGARRAWLHPPAVPPRPLTATAIGLLRSHPGAGVRPYEMLGRLPLG